MNAIRIQLTVLFLVGILISLFNHPSSIKTIGDSYDSLLLDNESLSFLRSLHENDVVCYHMGILFPWETLSNTDPENISNQAVLNIIHQLELNRNHYGFLFLNNPSPATKILDAGCGAGGISMLLHMTFNCFVDGYSLGAKEIEYANNLAVKQQKSDKLKFFQGNILKLPALDNFYDIIWISESSEYVDSLDSLFKEFKRIGKNGAQIIIFASCSKTTSIKKKIDTMYHTNMHALKNYEFAAKKHGYKLVFKQNLSNWVKPYWRLLQTSTLQHNEQDLAQAFLSNGLDYYFLCFTIQK